MDDLDAAMRCAFGRHWHHERCRRQSWRREPGWTLGDEHVQEDGAPILVRVERRRIGFVDRSLMTGPMGMNGAGGVVVGLVIVRMEMNQRRAQASDLNGEHQRERYRLTHDVANCTAHFQVISIPKKCMNTWRFGRFRAFCWGLRM